MAMGTRKQREKQEGLWIAHTELATAPGHHFYQKLNELLEAERFDEFVEARCIGRGAELRAHDKPKGEGRGIEELVTDKGYHSGAVIKRVKRYEVRSYIPEKKQKGQRNWAGKPAEQQAVYANRRRVRGEYARVYCGGAASSSNAASRTATRRA